LGIVWEKLIKTKITEDEIFRLSGLINESSEIKKIIEEYCDKTPPFKVVRVEGFRKGTAGYKSQAFKKIFTDLERGRAKDLSWDVYKFCVYKHVAHSYENLRRLIEDMDSDVDLSDSTDLLEIISKSAFLYNVTTDDLTIFYKFLWLPRSNSFQEIIKRCGKIDSGSEELQRRLKDAANIKGELIGKIQEITEKSTAIGEEVEGFNSSLENLKKKIEILEGKEKDSKLIISSLNDKVKNIEQNKEIDVKISDLENSKELTNSLINKLDKKISSIMVPYKNDDISGEIEKKIWRVGNRSKTT